jgi:hypothetical protein
VSASAEGDSAGLRLEGGRKDDLIGEGGDGEGGSVMEGRGRWGARGRARARRCKRGGPDATTGRAHAFDPRRAWELVTSRGPGF